MMINVNDKFFDGSHGRFVLVTAEHFGDWDCLVSEYDEDGNLENEYYQYFTTSELKKMERMGAR